MSDKTIHRGETKLIRIRPSDTAHPVTELSNARWNTLNGYGTITWHPIEGSEYETYMPGGAKYEEEMALLPTST